MLVLVLYVGLGCLVGVRLRDVMTWLVLDFDAVWWLLFRWFGVMGCLVPFGELVLWFVVWLSC